MKLVRDNFVLQISPAYIILIILAIFIVLMTIIYFLAIYPGKSRKDKIKTLRDWDYAHRGLHDFNAGIYENTIAAFEIAVKKSFGAELDVQLTSDGQVVVFHDFDLNRMCGVDKKVRDLTDRKSVV